MVMADRARSTCPSCGSGAVVAGFCATCGRRPYTPAELRVRRAARRRRQLQRSCAHRRWLPAGEQVINGERRRRGRCARCGVVRYVGVD